MAHETIGISLGWFCEAADIGCKTGLRKRKSEGYLTCPFDECLTNYDGILLCLKEDFKHFFDFNYLKTIPAPFTVSNITKGELLIYNTRYNFIFNHESPNHGNLTVLQKWPGGENHYINNNFALFIERYTRRINNFRNYLKTARNITFIIGKYDLNTTELAAVIRTVYPQIQFTILPFVPTKISYELSKEYSRLMTSSHTDARLSSSSS